MNAYKRTKSLASAGVNTPEAILLNGCRGRDQAKRALTAEDVRGQEFIAEFAVRVELFG
jgi:hypothetical protein